LNPAPIRDGKLEEKFDAWKRASASKVQFPEFLEVAGKRRLVQRFPLDPSSKLVFNVELVKEFAANLSKKEKSPSPSSYAQAGKCLSLFFTTSVASPDSRLSHAV
jgi:hypothetical protein